MKADTKLFPCLVSVAGAAVILTASSAGAAVSVSAPFLEIRASSAMGSATYFAPFPGAIDQFHDADNDLWQSNYGGPAFPLIDGGNGNTIAIVNSYFERAYRDGFSSPGTYFFGIDLSFNVNAGAADTTFEIYSTVLSFDPIDVSGNSAASNTMTDANSDTATWIGGLLNGHSFLAGYNGAVPGGTPFRTYLPGLAAGSGGSDSDTGDMVPPGSYDPIGVVSDLSLMFRFTVTAGDQAGGNGQFNVVPSPASLSLMGLGLLAAARRRR